MFRLFSFFIIKLTADGPPLLIVPLLWTQHQEATAEGSGPFDNGRLRRRWWNENKSFSALRRRHFIAAD